MSLPDHKIPERELPQCWSDDVRMNALFAPFRLKSANPESWNMKMKFWSDMIRQWCQAKRDPIISAADVKVAFQRKGRTAACIDIVVEEMYQSGELSPISKYNQILHSGPEGWVRWGARLAFKPATFAVSTMISLLPGRQALDSDGLPKATIESTQRFVVESIVKEQATNFLNDFPSSVERIGMVDELMRRSNFKGTRECFQILLGYLVSQGSAVRKDDIVKLALPNQKVSSISETDEALVKLLSCESKLQNDAERLMKEVTSAESDARIALQIGNRNMAKNHLRRKHKLKGQLDKCEAALDNVEQLLHTMRDVDVNTTIVDTYRTSSQAMKKGLQDGGLSEDTVHDTMDDLKDVMDTYQDIQNALSTPTEDFDAFELEEELREIMEGNGGSGGGSRQERQKTKKAEGPLPSPPKELPIQDIPSPPLIEPTRKRAERKRMEGDFVFDGEARVLAELNELSLDTSKDEPKPSRQKAKAIKEPWSQTEEFWGERAENSKRSFEDANKVFDTEDLYSDERLHPGQPLFVNLRTPERYSSEFPASKIDSDIWGLNNSLDNSLSRGSKSFCAQSPTSSSFDMAPGHERKKVSAQEMTDLESRLRDLRGFKS